MSVPPKSFVNANIPILSCPHHAVANYVPKSIFFHLLIFPQQYTLFCLSDSMSLSLEEGNSTFVIYKF